MIRLKFEPWVRRAVSKIRFPQDRINAERELLDHMEDRYCDLVEESSPEAALTQTIAAMGDADTVAWELGAVHRPFWGFLELYSGRVRRVMVLLTLICCFGFFLGRFLFLGGYEHPVYYRYDPYGKGQAFDSAGQMERQFYAAPGVTAQTDGYFFTLTKAALWQETGTDGSLRDSFYFRVRVQNPIPWAAYDDILRFFWAEDSLGNRYRAAYEPGEGPSIQGSLYHTGPVTWQYDMYLSDFVSQGAQWIDLHYDRSGRDMVLRIRLEGGTA